MKTIQITLTIVILFTFNLLSVSENPATSEKDSFSLSIKLENDFVTITNIEGCKFVQIGFLLKQDEKLIGFNEFGMFDIKKYKKQQKQSKPAKFSFSLRRNEKGILLKGAMGVEWENLLLEFNEKENSLSYLVNQSGIIKTISSLNVSGDNK